MVGEHTDLSSQIQVINLGYVSQDQNLFELASNYVDFSFIPLFTDYKNKTQAPTANTSEAASGGLEGVLKGLNQLKGHLAAARLNKEIPNVVLNIDPEVKAKFEAANATNTFVNINDFEDKLTNNEFLNRLHNIVQGWYKDIRKLTTLEHNVADGTAS